MMGFPEEFAWNDAKATANAAKHGVTFDYAARVFFDPAVLLLDISRAVDGEDREKAVGSIDGKLYTMVFHRRGRTLAGSYRPAAPTRRRRTPMAAVRFKLDPNNPPKLTAAQAARLDTMTEAEIEAAALSDPDNPPLTDVELARMVSARAVRLAREKTGLSQSAFATRFKIGLARLRDLEQGRTKADSAVLAYLRVIEREPKAVLRALA